MRPVTFGRFGRRLVCYTLEQGDPSRPVCRIVGKVYETAALGRSSFVAARRLWEAGFARRAPVRVRIPEPYAYLPDLRLLLMEEVRGPSVKKLLRQGRAETRHAQLVAEALAKLHRFPLVLGRPFTVEDHLAIRCRGLADEVARAFPDVRDAIRWIVKGAYANQARSGFALVHGDFHLGQVQLRDDDAWIVDLDQLHYGDPAYDVAMVFVALKQTAAKGKLDAYVRSFRDAFLSAYFSGTDGSLARRVPLHEALIHLKRAAKRFHWQDDEGWRETIRLLIRQSVRCLEAMPAAAPRSLSEMTDLYERCPGAI